MTGRNLLTPNHRVSMRLRIAAASFTAAAVVGAGLGAAPPTGGLARVLPEVDIDPPSPLACGWGQVLSQGEWGNPGIPHSASDSDWNPYTSWSESISGSGANLKIKAGSFNACGPLVPVLCGCESVDPGSLSASGWLKATVQPMPGVPQAVPVLFECNVSAKVIVKGYLDPENWCPNVAGSASVSAVGTLRVTGSFASNWGPTLVFRVDGSVSEGSQSVVVEGRGNEEGEVELTGSVSWTTTQPFNYTYSDIVDARWQWCGNPSGKWVKLTSDLVGAGMASGGADSSYEVEVRDASVTFSIVECACSGGGGNPVPVVENPWQPPN
jgi:hypothetical protein